MSYSISVIGSGSYGTALAISLARNGNRVLLFGRNRNKIDRMLQTRSNEDFLPGITFPETLDLTSDLEFAVANTNILLVVIPSSSFRSVLKQIKPYLTTDHRLAWATKGIEAQTGKLLSDVVKEEFGNDIPFAVISGPTFAKELAAGMPTAISVSGSSDEFIDEFSRLIHSSKNFRVYKNPDYIGIQIGGCVKNVIAIGAGLSDGLGFGANARTALGDLVLTCTDNQSRNRRFGLALGAGKTVDEAMKEIGQVVEGYDNTSEVYQLARKYDVEMPICEEIYKVLYEGKSPKDATATLLSRTQKSE